MITINRQDVNQRLVFLLLQNQLVVSSCSHLLLVHRYCGAPLKTSHTNVVQSFFPVMKANLAKSEYRYQTSNGTRIYLIQIIINTNSVTNVNTSLPVL